MGFWLSFLFVLSADYFSKTYVRAHLVLGETRVLISDFLFFTHVQNTGAAFGYLKGATLFLTAISAVCIGISLLLYPKLGFLGKGAPIYLGLVSGGAMGNLLDRVLRGSVTDFLSFKFFRPVFNLADAAIVSGSVLLGFLFFLFEKGQRP